jgi:hypothetical protein
MVHLCQNQLLRKVRQTDLQQLRSLKIGSVLWNSCDNEYGFSPVQPLGLPPSGMLREFQQLTWQTTGEE